MLSDAWLTEIVKSRARHKVWPRNELRRKERVRWIETIGTIQIFY